MTTLVNFGNVVILLSALLTEVVAAESCVCAGGLQTPEKANEECACTTCVPRELFDRVSKKCVTKCPAETPFQYDGNCYKVCPKGKVHNEGSFICKDTCCQQIIYKSCAYKYSDDSTCYQYGCPNNTCQCDELYLKTVQCLRSCSQCSFSRTLVLVKGATKMCVADCPGAVPLVYNSVCVGRCPPRTYLCRSYSSFGPHYPKCVDDCSSCDSRANLVRNDSSRLCVSECPADRFILTGNTCSEHCPCGTVMSALGFTFSYGSVKWVTCDSTTLILLLVYSTLWLVLVTGGLLLKHKLSQNYHPDRLRLTPVVRSQELQQIDQNSDDCSLITDITSLPQTDPQNSSSSAVRESLVPASHDIEENAYTSIDNEQTLVKNLVSDAMNPLCGDAIRRSSQRESREERRELDSDDELSPLLP